MNQNTVSGDIINLKLRQMNASNITLVRSNMYIVDFTLENGVIVSYVFNITKKDKYFLQRMRPYAMVQGKYADTREIVRVIRADLEKFRNAAKSHNFEEFVEISQKNLRLTEEVEDMFLTHNIDKAELDQINSELDCLLKRVKKLSEKSDAIVLETGDEAKKA